MENLQLEQTIRTNRVGKRKKKNALKLYIYLFIGLLLILAGITGIFLILQDSKSEDTVSEMPLELSLDISETTLSAPEATDNENSITGTEQETLASQGAQSNLPLFYANNEKPNDVQATETTLSANQTNSQIDNTHLIEKVGQASASNAQTTRQANPVPPAPSNTQASIIAANNQTTVIKTTPAVELNTQAVQISPNAATTTVKNPMEIKSTQPILKSDAPTTSTKTPTSTPTISTDYTSAPPVSSKSTSTNSTVAQQLELQALNVKQINEPQTATPSTQANGSGRANAHQSKNQGSKTSQPKKGQPAEHKQAAKVVKKQTQQTSATLTKPVRIDNGRGGNYTIQVASASSPEGLRKLAVSQNLITARVIETNRNGSAWYVLVTGNYASPAEAKRAIKTLPSKIQASQPWVRQSP